MQKILILGAGALGSNLSANLIADLKDKIELTVLDCDTVEERNTRGTQFYMREQIGQKKTEALQYNIYKWYGIEIETKYMLLGDDNIRELADYDLVIDCFDNEASRQRVQDGLNTEITGELLHCGFSDRLTFEVAWADNYEVPEDNPNARDVCELVGATGFIKIATGVMASVVEEYLETGNKKDVVGNRFSVTTLA